jgi:hypothetical protein
MKSFDANRTLNIDKVLPVDQITVSIELRKNYEYLTFAVLLRLGAKMNLEKLQKMAATVRTGGKGSVRRYVCSLLNLVLTLALDIHLTLTL